MRVEPDHEGQVREFRLEGLTLGVVAAVIVLLLLGSFYLGRWVERGRHPPLPSAAASGEDALGGVVSSEEPIDVGESMDHFDTVEGGQKEREPGREVRRPAETAPPPRAAEPAPPAESGSHYVQVWAGRDRRAAELLVDKLSGEGFPVRLFSDRAEGDTLFKVRVGGFASEGRAREVAADLEGKGYRGAWVTTVD